MPCRSTRGNAFFVELADPEAPLGAPDPEADIARERGRDRHKEDEGEMRAKMDVREVGQ